MHSLFVCYEVSWEYLEHLEYGIPNSDKVSDAKNKGSVNEAEIEAATREYVKKITYRLDNFLLKPKGIKCEALLDHMMKFRKRNNKKGDNKTKVLSYLAADINKEQEKILNPTIRDITQDAIFACASWADTRLKLPKRKLNNLRYIISRCRIQIINKG